MSLIHLKDFFVHLDTGCHHYSSRLRSRIPRGFASKICFPPHYRPAPAVFDSVVKHFITQPQRGKKTRKSIPFVSHFMPNVKYCQILYINRARQRVLKEIDLFLLKRKYQGSFFSIHPRKSGRLNFQPSFTC